MPETPGEGRGFYETFGPVFARNAVWSRKKPVPGLGDDALAIQKVLAFYDFWERFESWRDFTHEEEYDLAQAESRYERRYMERENKRMKADKFKEEHARIRKLVNAAYAHDPRVQTHLREQEEAREQQRAARRKEKEAKIEAEKARIDAAKAAEAQAAEEARLQKEEEARRAADAKQHRRNLEKKLRVEFLEQLGSKKHDNFYLDELLPKLKPEGVAEILTSLEAREFADIDQFESRFNSLVSGYKKEAETQAKKTQTTQQGVEWSKEQLSQLAKGVIKFPPGTQARWERIAKFLGNEFTELQVAAKAAEIKSNPNNLPKAAEKPEKVAEKPVEKTEKPPAEKTGPEAWSQTQQAQLESALKKYPASLEAKTRWEKIASEVEAKDVKDCVERMKYLKEKLAKAKTK